VKNKKPTNKTVSVSVMHPLSLVVVVVLLTVVQANNNNSSNTGQQQPNYASFSSSGLDQDGGLQPAVGG
jgi:hypothetical protein